MNNFGRAIRMALLYRWTFASSVLCAILVAVMWGGNLGTIYPFVEVAFRGQSLHNGWMARSRRRPGRAAS